MTVTAKIPSGARRIPTYATVQAVVLTRTLTVALAMATAMATPGANAQSYPDKAVHVVVPFAPGGRVDAIGRLLCEALTREMGQPCVVDNKAGAGGAIGTEFVARSKADGYTLLMASAGIMSILPNSGKKLGYDPVKDFTPVSGLVVGYTYIGVNKDFKARTLPELITMARQKPATIGYATSGIGTFGHLAGELLTQVAAAPLLHIPYKGTGPAVVDILAGHVPVMIAGELGDLVKDGGVRILATTNQTRPPDFPDVPTMKELGYPQFSADSWIALFAPAGLDPAIRARLNPLIEKTLKDPQVAAKVRSLGTDVAYTDGPALARQVANDLDVFSQIIGKAGLKFE